SSSDQSGNSSFNVASASPCFLFNAAIAPLSSLPPSAAAAAPPVLPPPYDDVLCEVEVELKVEFKADVFDDEERAVERLLLPPRELVLMWPPLPAAAGPPRVEPRPARGRSWGSDITERGVTGGGGDDDDDDDDDDDENENRLCSEKETPKLSINERGSGGTAEKAAKAAGKREEKKGLTEESQSPPDSLSSHEDHLLSILMHPLFALPRLSRNPQPHSHPHSHSQSHSNTPFTKQAEEAGDPLSILNRLIATGRADKRALSICLSKLSHDLAGPASASITAWYDSAPRDDRFKMLGDRGLMGKVMVYLVCAGKQEVVGRWLGDVFEETRGFEEWWEQMEKG
ncbi:phosphatidylinositol-3,5-bisphosphate 5-phosphatase, partial [Ascosphaera pollenicola]